MSIRNIKKQASSGATLATPYNKFLFDKARNDTSHRDGKMHPSYLSGCPTAAALAYLAMPVDDDTFDAQALRIFAHGHAIHHMLQRDFTAAGMIDVVDGKPLIEVFVEIPEINLIGHADGVVREGVAKGVPRSVLEIKSINSNAFRLLKEPKPEHKIQAAAYALALALDHTLFVYYAKDTSEMGYYLHKVSPREIGEVYTRASAVQALCDAWTAGGAFPDPAHGLTSKPPCSWCQWKRICHSTFERQAYIDARLKERENETRKEATEEPKKGTTRKLGKRPTRLS